METPKHKQHDSIAIEHYRKQANKILSNMCLRCGLRPRKGHGNCTVCQKEQRGK